MLGNGECPHFQFAVCAFALGSTSELATVAGQALAYAVLTENLPALAATHTGPMYEQRRGVLLALQADGRVIRYPENSQYRVEIDEGTIEVDSDVARFEICGVDDGERVVAATGEVVAGGVVTVEAHVAMQRVDGVWKLAERQQLAEWEGVAGCAVE